MAEISVLPCWKKGASAYERLEELALHARQYPEKYEKFTLVSQELLPNGNWKIRTVSFKLGGEALNILEEMGLLQAGSNRVWENSSK